MQIIIYLLVGIIMTMANYYLIEKDKSLVKIIKSFLGFLFVFNVVVLGVIKFILGQTDILSSAYYTIIGCMKYSVFALMIGFIYFLFRGATHNKFSNIGIIAEQKIKKSKKDLIINVISSVGFGIGVLFIFFSDWFIEYFGEITPEQFLFNLKSPLKGTSSGMATEIIQTPVFSIIFSVTVFIIVMTFSYNIFIKDKMIISKKVIKVISTISSGVVLVGGCAYGINKLSLDEVAAAYFSDSSYIEDNYIDPREIEMVFPEKKRNLIHIYLESVESSYFSKELGGHMDVNLMPELTGLMDEGISFSHNDKFGGPHQTYGSSWSVASMINMGSGIPLKTPMANNSYGKNGTFLPGIITIGDILEAQGYNQTIMFGADADFGGLTTYFETHGNFNIFDYKAAIEKGLIPEDYYVWWGYEDDKLYDYAKEELTRLHNEGKPFNFTMETADTHFPDGYLSENAEQKHDKKYANVISYSTKEAVEFIRWIQEQPFYDNTTVVVTGDHLSMDKNFFTDFDKDYRRSVFNLILNSEATTENTKNREFAPFDMFPTIMTSMGIEFEGDMLGIGTDLFSDSKTLIERDGLDALEENLNANSNFFMDEFIDATKESIFENNLVTYK